jgi:MoxR-like ATPase
MNVSEAGEQIDGLREQMTRIIVGQEAVVDQLIVALISGGHALLEGVPGTAKTLAARILAMLTGLRFRRVQMTPDLMPSDIVGVNIYDTAAGEFRFRPGPVFADIVLADEINRAPAKTQSALLEAMQERQVTIDGVSHAMSPVFMVLATQNPVEFEGTYALPEAEVDRFLLKIAVDYPSEHTERQVLDLAVEGLDPANLDALELKPAISAEQLGAMRELHRGLNVEPTVRDYINVLVRRTREHPQVSLGASPRAGVMLLQAARGWALLAGRDFVTPDDVKTMAMPALHHRLLLHPEAQVEGVSERDVLRSLLDEVEVPR